MFLLDYIWFIVALLVCMLFSAYASAKVHTTFSKYNKVSNRSIIFRHTNLRQYDDKFFQIFLTFPVIVL